MSLIYITNQVLHIILIKNWERKHLLYILLWNVTSFIALLQILLIKIKNYVHGSAEKRNMIIVISAFIYIYCPQTSCINTLLVVDNLIQWSFQLWTIKIIRSKEKTVKKNDYNRYFLYNCMDKIFLILVEPFFISVIDPYSHMCCCDSKAYIL